MLSGVKNEKWTKIINLNQDEYNLVLRVSDGNVLTKKSMQPLKAVLGMKTVKQEELLVFLFSSVLFEENSKTMET